MEYLLISAQAVIIFKTLLFSIYVQLNCVQFNTFYFSFFHNSYRFGRFLTFCYVSH